MTPPNTGVPINRITRFSMRSVTTSGTAAVLPYSTVRPPLPLPYASAALPSLAAGDELLPAACCCRWRSCSSYAACSACTRGVGGTGGAACGHAEASGRVHGWVELECATCQCMPVQASCRQRGQQRPLAQRCSPPNNLTCSCSTVCLGEGREATLPRLLFCSKRHRMGAGECAEAAHSAEMCIHAAKHCLMQASRRAKGRRATSRGSGWAEAKPALGHSSAPAD